MQNAQHQIIDFNTSLHRWWGGAHALQSAVNVRWAPIQELLEFVTYIRNTGTCNVYGARVAMETAWNTQLMENLAESTSDREVVQFMRYGWPLSHDGSPTTITLENHTSALKHHRQVTEYVVKEWKLGCLLRPFVTVPWGNNMAVSPMSTRAKKNSAKRRILMDLSWPRNGASVNDGISKEYYLEQPVNLQYPTVDKLCKKAVQIGHVMGYKRVGSGLQADFLGFGLLAASGHLLDADDPV